MSEKFNQTPQPAEGREEKGKTRRGILKWIAGAGAGVAVGRYSPELWQHRREIRKGAEDFVLDILHDVNHDGDAAIQAAQEFMRREYGTEVDFAGYEREEGYRGDPTSVEEARNAMTHIIRALSLYPKDFFKQNNLPAIRVARNLRPESWSRADSFRVGGTAIGWSNYLAVSSSSLLDIEASLHHELYHVLDWRDNGYNEDRLWEDITNSCSCGGYLGVSPETRPLPSRLDIFASAEGQMNPVEDRATIAEALLTPAQNASLAERIESMRQQAHATPAEAEAISQKLRVLEEKIGLIKRDYGRWSNGAMNEQFWERLRLEGERQIMAATYDTYTSQSYSYGPPISGEETRIIEPRDQPHESRPGPDEAH